MGGGGSERQLALLVTGQKKLGIEVFVILRKAGKNYELLKSSGAEVLLIEYKSNYDPRALYKIIKFISKNKIDLIQTWLPQMDILGGVAALIAKKPFILSERSCAEAYSPCLKNSIRKIVGKLSSAVIANSYGGINYWNKLKYKENNVVIRNINPINFSNDEKFELENNAKRIIYAGRYINYKNIFLLINALKIVLEKTPNLIIDFYGEGDDRGAIIELCNRLGLGKIIAINPYISNLFEELKKSSLFVSLSIFEGNPNTVIEAALSGCPLLLSDIPAHREFLDDSSANFVKINSVKDVAQAIINALNNQDLLKQKSLVAKARVSEWTEESISSQYYSLYKNILI
jgi:glycosyltransferase involved in cell wall biosynthesis